MKFEEEPERTRMMSREEIVPRELCARNCVKCYKVIIKEWKSTNGNQEVIDKLGQKKFSRKWTGRGGGEQLAGAKK